MSSGVTLSLSDTDRTRLCPWGGSQSIERLETLLLRDSVEEAEAQTEEEEEEDEVLMEKIGGDLGIWGLSMTGVLGRGVGGSMQRKGGGMTNFFFSLISAIFSAFFSRFSPLAEDPKELSSLRLICCLMATPSWVIMFWLKKVLRAVISRVSTEGLFSRWGKSSSEASLESLRSSSSLNSISGEARDTVGSSLFWMLGDLDIFMN